MSAEADMVLFQYRPEAPRTCHTAEHMLQWGVYEGGKVGGREKCSVEDAWACYRPGRNPGGPVYLNYDSYDISDYRCPECAGAPERGWALRLLGPGFDHPEAGRKGGVSRATRRLVNKFVGHVREHRDKHFTLTPTWIVEHVPELLEIDLLGAGRARELVTWAVEIGLADLLVGTQALEEIHLSSERTACRWCSAERRLHIGRTSYCPSCGMPTRVVTAALTASLHQLQARLQAALVAHDEALGPPAPTKARVAR